MIHNYYAIMNVNFYCTVLSTLAVEWPWEWHAQATLPHVQHILCASSQQEPSSSHIQYPYRHVLQNVHMAWEAVHLATCVLSVLSTARGQMLASCEFTVVHRKLVPLHISSNLRESNCHNIHMWLLNGLVGTKDTVIAKIAQEWQRVMLCRCVKAWAS